MIKKGVMCIVKKKFTELILILFSEKPQDTHVGESFAERPLNLKESKVTTKIINIF